MSKARDRYHALKGSNRKKPLFGNLRAVLIVVVLVGLLLVYSKKMSFDGNLISSALSKQNHGIVLNYFYMSPKRTVEMIGEPQTTTLYRENEQLHYWRFDPVTLELHYNNEQVARIAFATSNEIIRDHIEGRALKVYAREEDWRQRRRNIDGELKLVYENEPARMTVVKYQKSVMVYNYLFPDKLARVSE